MYRATLDVAAEAIIRRSLRKFDLYMCKSSFLVKASVVAPITTGGTGHFPHSFWKY